MALIVHDSHATSVAHDGTTYTADKNGVVDVADRIAAELVRFPGWHYFEPEAEKIEGDAEKVIAGLRARIAELEQPAKKTVGRAAKSL